MFALYVLDADLGIDLSRAFIFLVGGRALVTGLVHLNQACASVGVFHLIGLSQKAFNRSIDRFVSVLFGPLQHVGKLVPRPRLVQHGLQLDAHYLLVQLRQPNLGGFFKLFLSSLYICRSKTSVHQFVARLCSCYALILEVLLRVLDLQDISERPVPPQTDISLVEVDRLLQYTNTLLEARRLLWIIRVRLLTHALVELLDLLGC